MKYNIHTKHVSEFVPSGVYGGVDYHGEPPDDVAVAAGWVDVTPEIQHIINADKVIIEAERAQSEALRQASKSISLKTVENNFLLLCEQLSGSKDRLGFDYLKSMLTAMAATNKDAAVMITLELQAINQAGIYEGGTKWFDDCVWHQEIVPQ